MAKFVDGGAVELYHNDTKTFETVADDMTKAAKNKTGFHLWWHPHNFGVNTKENIKNLANILSYYNHLREKYGMKSSKMSDISSL